jgi:ubiquinone/menaquinone biosynthesis C-methylase UbiE
VTPFVSRAIWIFLHWFFRYLYTSLAWSYDAVAWLSSLGQWEIWRRTALDRVAAGTTTLELGFGTGHLQEEAQLAGLRAFGVDASPQMVRITARRLRRAALPLRLVRARAQALPFPRSTFPQLISTFPSEYIFDPASLGEIRRILMPGGTLVVVFSALIRPRFPWERLTRWLYEQAGQAPGPDEKWLTPFRDAGFQVRLETVEVPGASVLQIIATT